MINYTFVSKSNPVVPDDRFLDGLPANNVVTQCVDEGAKIVLCQLIVKRNFRHWGNITAVMPMGNIGVIPVLQVCAEHALAHPHKMIGFILQYG